MLLFFLRSKCPRVALQADDAIIVAPGLLTGQPTIISILSQHNLKPLFFADS
jgi:hypothetical protein